MDLVQVRHPHSVALQVDPVHRHLEALQEEVHSLNQEARLSLKQEVEVRLVELARLVEARVQTLVLLTPSKQTLWRPQGLIRLTL